MSKTEVSYIIKARDSFSVMHKRADVALNKTVGAIDRMSKAGLILAGGAGAVSASLFVMMKRTAEVGDQAGKLSARIGTTVEGFTELSHAASLSNVSVNALSTSLQRQTRRIAEAAQGTGEAKKALAELGLSAVELKNLAPDDQFMQIAGAMEQVDSQADKVRLAMKLWDSEGVTMLQMLEGGTAGLKQMREEAAILGLTFTDLEARQMADFNDALTRLQGSFSGISNTVSKEMIPYTTAALQVLTDRVKGANKDIENSSSSVGKEIFNIMEDTALGVAEVADTIRPAIDGVWSEIQFMWSGFKGLPGWVQDAGIAGALLGGKKGVLVVGSLLHLSTALKNSARGFEAAFKGQIDWSDLATMNAQDLAVALDKIDAKQKAITGGAQAANAGGLLPDLPDKDSYVASVQEIFDEIKARRRQNEEDLGNEAAAAAANEKARREDAWLLAETMKQAQRENEAQVEMTQAAKLTEIQRLEAEKRKDIEEQTALQIRSIRFTVGYQMVGLMRTLGKESTTAALAAIALEKSLGIAQTVINTNVAAMRALADLGPIAGAVAAAKIKALGAVSVGIIAAQGLAQAHGAMNGGSGGIASAGAGTSGSTGYRPTLPPPVNPAAEQYGSGYRSGEGQDRPVIIIKGDVYAQDEEAFKKKILTHVHDDIREGGDTNGLIQAYV